MLVQDMFSGELTAPKVEIDWSEGFEAFWKCYPSTTRKVAKIQCQKKWERFMLAPISEHICAHLRWMRTQEDWMKQNGAFICAPLVYLNQQRWVGWEPPQKPAIDPAAATRELLAERDRNYRPPSAEIRAKLEALRGKR